MEPEQIHPNRFINSKGERDLLGYDARQFLHCRFCFNYGRRLLDEKGS